MTDLVTLGIINTSGLIIVAYINNRKVGFVKNVIDTVKNKVEAIGTKQEQIHEQINGQQALLLKSTEKASHLEGEKEGRAKLLDEQDPTTNTKPS